MVSQNSKRSDAGHLLKILSVGNLFFILILIRLISDPFNAYAGLDFDPNKYELSGKTSEQCEQDLKMAISEFKNLRDNRFNKLLKEESSLHREIIKEIKKGMSYVQKHTELCDYISHMTSDLRPRLTKILNNFGGLPFEPTKAQLAQEWKALNELTKRSAALKKAVCKHKSSEKPLDQSKIERIKKIVESEEDKWKKLNSNLIDLIKLNSDALKLYNSDKYNIKNVQKYYVGIFNVSKLLDWNYLKDYSIKASEIEKTYKKLEEIRYGIDHMLRTFKNSKKGRISFIPDMYFVYDWKIGTEKNFVMEMQLIRNTKKEIDEDQDINDITSIYNQIKIIAGGNVPVKIATEIPITHPIYNRNKKAREDWNELLKVRTRCNNLIDQYRSTVKTMGKYVEGAKQCLKKIENKNTELHCGQPCSTAGPACSPKKSGLETECVGGKCLVTEEKCRDHCRKRGYGPESSSTVLDDGCTCKCTK